MSHGFETGDFVTYEFSGVADEQIVGLDSGRTYRVVKIQILSSSLLILDGSAIADYGAVAGVGDGTGAKFHLNSLGNAPTVGVSGASSPVASEVLGAEELEIYGYVGKETAIFKTGATARDIANSVNALESKTGVYANASTHARIYLTTR